MKPIKTYPFYLFFGSIFLAVVFGLLDITVLYIVFVSAALGSLVIFYKQTPNYPVQPTLFLEPIPPPEPSEIVSPIVKRKEEFLQRRKEIKEKNERRIQKDFDLRIQTVKDGILQAETNGKEYCHFYTVGEFKIETAHLLKLMKLLGHRAYFERCPHHAYQQYFGHLVIAFFDFPLSSFGYEYVPITEDFPPILSLTQRA